MISMHVSSPGPRVNGLIPAAWVASTRNLVTPLASAEARIANPSIVTRSKGGRSRSARKSLRSTRPWASETAQSSLWNRGIVSKMSLSAASGVSTRRG